jgi:exodeoxyribonuclease VII small subunit
MVRVSRQRGRDCIDGPVSRLDAPQYGRLPGDGRSGPLTTMTPWFSPTAMPRQSAPVAPPPPLRYEEALAELERLVQRMEDGQLPLDQLLDNYRRGAELLESCRARLAAIEEQVKVLEDGQLKPWISGAAGA